MLEMQEQDRPQPRTKQTPSVLDDRISYAISNKGGISIYGLRRFPFTFYQPELETILSLGDELKEYWLANKELLSEDKPDAGAKNGKPDQYTVNASDIAIVAAESKRLQESGDMAGAVKYATIKSVAEMNKYKVSEADLNEIVLLKVRPKA